MIPHFFLNKEERNIRLIFNEIERYIGFKADTLNGLILYFKDLSKRCELNLPEDEIALFTENLYSKISKEDLSRKNILYIISQFVLYVIFEGDLGNKVKTTTQHLIYEVENIESTYKYIGLKDDLRLILNNEKFLNPVQIKKISHNSGEQLLKFLLFGLIILVIVIVLGALSEL